MQCWRLDGGPTTVVFGVEGALPFVVYWGRSLPKTEDLKTLSLAQKEDISGGVLDVAPMISLTPNRSDLFPGQPGMILRDLSGRTLVPNLKLTTVDEGLGHIEFHTEEDGLSITYTIKMDLETGILIMTSALRSQLPIFVDWLAAPVLPIPHSATRISEFSGSWCNEFQEITPSILPGARLREATQGRSSHEAPPFVSLSSNQGTFGFHYGWSGGHRMISEELPNGRRMIQFGHARDEIGAAKTEYETAPLFALHASSRNALARLFQTYARKTLASPRNAVNPRPVHYNCWEAVYFKHDLETLKDIATRAARLGAERFVLDDGWFGRRDDDTTSLGDWFVDPRKYPDGLSPLIAHVESLEMGFGIWIEPEMVSVDSDLYRAHPDWVLGLEFQPQGRHQHVLDLSRAEVRDHLFQSISELLTKYPIEYVKWDHNRVTPLVSEAQTEGYYELLDRLIDTHREVDFESCASGGGRIDFGVLQRCSRLWLSDSNDALERWKIQTSAANFLPSEYQGSHVGPRICHTSGRALPMVFRAWVAASRHMGFEMDPRELTSEEEEALMRITSWYKENRDWMHKGYAFQLPKDDPAVLGEIQISNDAEQFVAMIAQMESSRQAAPRPVRLLGLDPQARYQIKLLNPECAARVSRGKVALRDGPIALSSRALQDHGVALPAAFPNTMWIIEGKRI